MEGATRRNSPRSLAALGGAGNYAFRGRVWRHFGGAQPAPPVPMGCQGVLLAMLFQCFSPRSLQGSSLVVQGIPRSNFGGFGLLLAPFWDAFGSYFRSILESWEVFGRHFGNCFSLEIFRVWEIFGMYFPNIWVKF